LFIRAGPIHVAKNVGSGNGSSSPRYSSKKEKPLVVLMVK
jgi:hypothetical protein